MSIPMEVRIGTYPVDELRRRLLMAGVEIGVIAGKLLDSMELSVSPSVVQIVVLTREELGLSGEAPFTEVLSAVGRKGFRLCPPEVALYLSLAYRGDQWLIVGCEPMVLGDQKFGFCLKPEEGKPGLWASYADGTPLDTRFKYVFVRN